MSLLPGRPGSNRGEAYTDPCSKSRVLIDIPTIFQTGSEEFECSFTVVARVNYRKILEEEAAKNGVRVFYHNKGAQWGRAALGSKRIFVPKPARFPSFFTGLHELGHITSRHHAGDGKPEYLWEYEAFSWALEFCKKKRIPVPEKTIDNERNIIAEKIRWETDTGVKQVNPAVAKFVKEGDDEDPDVEYVRKFIADDGTVLLASN